MSVPARPLAFASPAVVDARRPIPAIRGRALVGPPFGITLGRAPLPTAKAPTTHALPTEPPPLRPPGTSPGREPGDRGPRDRRPEEDALDPTTRRMAQLGPSPLLALPAASAGTGSTPALDAAPHARVSMEELLPQLVRRIAWAGDRRRGTAVLELGAGRYAGTTITVHADDGRVRLELRGADADGLGPRIAERLARRGIEVESVG